MSKAPIGRHVAALEAKNRFGELLNAAQREPVTIEKHGKAVAVLVSQTEFEELQALKLELLKIELEKGFADFEAGRTVDSKVVFDELRARRKR